MNDRAETSALVIGRLFRDGIEDVHEAIRRASIEPVLAMTDDIVRASREGRTPAVVVLDESRESELALAALRGTWSHQSVPVIQLVRHASTADTILCAGVIANRRRLRLRYVLKRELLWDP